MFGIPNLSDIVGSWSVPMSALLIKKTMENRVQAETEIQIDFIGVPLQTIHENANRRIDGIRKWQQYTLYCNYEFFIEDVIILENSQRLRIIEKKSWNKEGYYGYYEYIVQEDYNNG